MSIHVDREFVSRISSRLLRFKKNATDKYNFRCPYCGDSKKSKNKARGNLYAKADNMFYICFNCSVSTTFGKLLQFLDNDLYKEYVVEKFSNKRYTKTIVEEKLNPISTLFEGRLPTMMDLYLKEPSNPAVLYMKSRKLPKIAFESFYYTDNFAEYTNSLTDKELKSPFDKPRIIIPMITEDGIEYGFQGRAIEETENQLRYVSITINKRFTKQFGMHLINRSKPIWVVEGVMDSFFLPNCIASLDSDLAGVANKLKLPKNTFIVHDNEPRNREIMKVMKKSIKSDYNVVFWSEKYTEKDINDLIMTGIDPVELYKDLKDSAANGIEAQLKFTKYAKINLSV